MENFLWKKQYSRMNDDRNCIQLDSSKFPQIFFLYFFFEMIISYDFGFHLIIFVWLSCDFNRNQSLYTNKPGEDEHVHKNIDYDLICFVILISPIERGSFFYSTKERANNAFEHLPVLHTSSVKKSAHSLTANRLRFY